MVREEGNSKIVFTQEVCCAMNVLQCPDCMVYLYLQELHCIMPFITVVAAGAMDARY